MRAALKTKCISFRRRDGRLILNVFCSRVKEEAFWKNYFYRVSLIKQSAQLTALAAQQAAECGEARRAGANHEAPHPKGTIIAAAINQNAAFSGGNGRRSFYSSTLSYTKPVEETEEQFYPPPSPPSGGGVPSGL